MADNQFIDGYVYDEEGQPILNKDGTHRRAPGRPSIPTEIKEIRKELVISQREKDREAVRLYKKEIESRDLLKQLMRRDFDAVGRLMDLVDDPDTDKRTATNILLKLVDMAYPKLTAMNVNAEAGEAMVFNIQIGGKQPKTIDITPSE